MESGGGRQFRTAHGTKPLLLISLQSLDDLYSPGSKTALDNSVQSPGQRKGEGQRAKDERTVSDKFGPFLWKLSWKPHLEDCLFHGHDRGSWGSVARKIQDSQLNLSFRQTTNHVLYKYVCLMLDILFSFVFLNLESLAYEDVYFLRAILHLWKSSRYVDKEEEEIDGQPEIYASVTMWPNTYQ